MGILIEAFGASHVGQRRPSNEDQFMIADLNKSMHVHQTSLGLNHQTRLFGESQGKLMLVADGVGGHESGERASTLAVDGVTNYVLNAMDWFFRLNSENRAEFESHLIESFKHTQCKLLEESDAIPQRRGMATTLTMAFVCGPHLYVVHVGDTRCYHIADDNIRQLTKDHTLAQIYADVAGSNNDTNQISSSRIANSLWNVVGGSDPSLDPQLVTGSLSPGDSLLLCSDGLTRYVSDKELLASVKQEKTTEAICHELIELANDRGGKDNITIVIARVLSPDQPPTGESAKAGANVVPIQPEIRPSMPMTRFKQ